MSGPIIRIVLSLVFAGAILFYLCHSAASLVQPQATVHSTLTPKSP